MGQPFSFTLWGSQIKQKELVKYKNVIQPALSEVIIKDALHYRDCILLHLQYIIARVFSVVSTAEDLVLKLLLYHRPSAEGNIIRRQNLEG